MNELSEDIGLDGPFDLSSTDLISEQSEQVYHGSINGSLLSHDYDLKLHNETMRLIFITVAIIIVLVCITISTILCIYICLNRYVEDFYYQLDLFNVSSHLGFFEICLFAYRRNNPNNKTIPEGIILKHLTNL
jgi:hypothetical protein